MILDKMRGFLVESLGISEGVINPETSVFQLGIDSVMMITVVNEINQMFHVSLSLSDITFKYNTIGLICDYISMSQNHVADKKTDINVLERKEEKEEIKALEQESVLDKLIENTNTNYNDICNVLIQQKDTMETIFLKQLEVLKYISNGCYAEEDGVGKKANESEKRVKEKYSVKENTIQTIESPAANNINLKKKEILSESQQRMLNQLILSLTTKTAKSKKLAEEYRKYLADLDEIAGFSLLLKELHYQISVESSNGSKMLDVDGNEYVDIAMGFGSLILGYSPKLVTDAVKDEIDRGLQLAPRHRLVGEVAKLVCELTGFDRANFTVTGTEAVMTAMKLARTYTRKSKIGIFTGGYHGHNDATLITKMTKEGTIKPIAPGISRATMNDMVLFDYNDMNTIKKIEEMKDELAAVIIEPVQSRRPEVQPIEFLKAIRKVTENNGILMIFDEVITGFRCNTGGAKRLFGIEPDLATYGKAACNGMPIGIVAGKEKVMDVADGGQWHYGDASYPMVEQTFYAGTFFKHPYTMAAAYAILNFYKENNNALQEELAKKTTYLVSKLDDIFKKYQVPIEVDNFTSLFKFKAIDQGSFMDIFYYKLLDYGIFTWEGRTCFLSAAHTDEDIEKIIEAVEKVVIDMTEAGFYKEAKIGDSFVKNIPDELYYE